MCISSCCDRKGQQPRAYHHSETGTLAVIGTHTDEDTKTDIVYGLVSQMR